MKFCLLNFYFIYLFFDRILILIKLFLLFRLNRLLILLEKILYGYIDDFKI